MFESFNAIGFHFSKKPFQEIDKEKFHFGRICKLSHLDIAQIAHRIT